MNTINRNVPDDLDVYVILDNLSTHKTQPCTNGCSATDGSISISHRPTDRGGTSSSAGSRHRRPRNRRSAHNNVAELAAEINTWVDTWNQNPKPVGEQLIDVAATSLSICRRTGFDHALVANSTLVLHHQGFGADQQGAPTQQRLVTRLAFGACLSIRNGDTNASLPTSMSHHSSGPFMAGTRSTAA
jgi:hypothetical protein